MSDQYWLYLAEEQCGPFTLSQIQHMWRRGAITTETLYCQHGFDQWFPLSTIVEELGVLPTLSPISLSRPSTLTRHPDALTERLANSSLPTTIKVYSALSADRSVRLGASLLDLLIAGVCFTLGMLSLFVFAIYSESIAAKTLGIILMSVFIGGFLFAQLRLLVTRGQTIGKKIMNIKIVKNADDSLPSPMWLLFFRGMLNIFAVLPYIGWLLFVTDYCFIFRDDRRCLHDLIAQTKVVKV